MHHYIFPQIRNILQYSIKLLLNRDFEFIHYPIIVNLRYIITSIYILGLYSRPGGAEWLCMDLSCNISFIFYY